MKLNLSAEVMDLDGNTMNGPDGKPITMARIVSQVLSQQTKSADPIKDFEIAGALHRDGECELYGDDVKMIERAIKGSEQYTSLATGQILAEIARQKEASKPEKKKAS
nr:hypothetical protein 14 [Spirochaetaceae bacterium]